LQLNNEASGIAMSLSGTTSAAAGGATVNTYGNVNAVSGATYITTATFWPEQTTLTVPVYYGFWSSQDDPLTTSNAAFDSADHMGCGLIIGTNSGGGFQGNYSFFPTGNAHGFSADYAAATSVDFGPGNPFTADHPFIAELTQVVNAGAGNMALRCRFSGDGGQTWTQTGPTNYDAHGRQWIQGTWSFGMMSHYSANIGTKLHILNFSSTKQ
jgi:hypothetical protein